MTRPLTLRTMRAGGLALAATAALVVIGGDGTWRLALLAALLAGAVGLTRLRYAPLASVALLALVAALAASGRSAGADQRARAHVKADQAHDHHKAPREKTQRHRRPHHR